MAVSDPLLSDKRPALADAGQRRPMSTRVLITGGAGFIGSHFVKLALRTHADWHIVNLDKLTYAGNPANLPDDKRHEFVEGDIATGTSSRNSGATVSTSSSTSPPKRTSTAPCLPPAIRQDRRARHIYASGGSPAFGVKKFIQISTDEVYGKHCHRQSDGEHAVAPGQSLRRQQKLPAIAGAGERFAGRRHALHEQLRPEPTSREVHPLFITNALEDKPLPLYGDGKNVRDWIYVEDHCAAVDRLIEAGKPGENFTTLPAGMRSKTSRSPGNLPATRQTGIAHQIRRRPAEP